MDLPDIFHNDKLALLVIDKQAAYFDERLVEQRGHHLPTNSADILENIDNLVVFMRNKQVPIIWTQMVEDSELSPPNIALKMKRDNYTSISNPDNAAYEIIGSTKPDQDESVFQKIFYDAFSIKELGKYMQNKGVKTVIIVGGYASRCVLATAVGANNLGLNVVIPRDGVVNQEESIHELDAMFSIVDAILGYVTDTTNIKTRLV